MTQASHYVIEDILEKKDDYESFKGALKTFVSKYPEDRDLRSVLDGLEGSDDHDLPETILSQLSSLKELRRLESSGGGGSLPYKDRRHL